MPVSWRDDPETYRAIVIEVVLGQVRKDPAGFKEMTKPTVQQNSKSRSVPPVHRYRNTANANVKP